MMSTIEVNKVEQPGLAKHDSSVLDLAFVMDCTGSMGSYIHTAQQNIRRIVEEIVASEKSDVQLALVEYRDHPPEDSTFITRTNGFTNSVSKMKKWLDNCSAQGGGDEPEAVADGLYQLLKLNWRSNATKICVLVSDAPPHGLGVCGDGFPNGCPSGIDPMETTQQLASKGITLYSVGCEPAISPYKEFFMAIAYMTGGQYIPLTGAGLLTQVIIGGAQEELSLEQWMTDVDQEVQADLQAGREIDDDAISKRIQEKLNLKGAKAKQLQRNKAALAAPTENAVKLSKFSNMADVKKNMAFDQPAFGSPFTKSTKHSRRRAAPPSGAMPLFGGAPPPPMGPSCSSMPPPPAPMMTNSFMPLSGSGFEENCNTEPEAYNVVESEMSYSQVSRMVQRSKAKNMAAFKKS